MKNTNQLSAQRWSKSGDEIEVNRILFNSASIGFTWAGYNPTSKQASIIATDLSGNKLGYFKNEQTAMEAIAVASPLISYLG